MAPASAPTNQTNRGIRRGYNDPLPLTNEKGLCDQRPCTVLFLIFRFHKSLGQSIERGPRAAQSDLNRQICKSGTDQGQHGSSLRPL